MSDEYLRERAHTIKENAAASGSWQASRRFINAVYGALEDRDVPEEALLEYSEMRGDYFDAIAGEIDGPGGRERLVGVDEVNEAYAEDVADWIADYLESGDTDGFPAAPGERPETEQGYGSEEPQTGDPGEAYGPRGQGQQETGEAPEETYEPDTDKVPEQPPQEPSTSEGGKGGTSGQGGSTGGGNGPTSGTSTGPDQTYDPGQQPGSVGQGGSRDTGSADSYDENPIVAVSDLRGYAEFLLEDREYIFGRTFEDYMQNEEGIDVGRDDYTPLINGDAIGPDTGAAGEYHDNEAVLEYVLDRVEDGEMIYNLGDSELDLIFRDADTGSDVDDWVNDIGEDLRKRLLEDIVDPNYDINVVTPGYNFAYAHGGTNDAVDDIYVQEKNQGMQIVAQALREGSNADEVYQGIYRDIFENDGLNPMTTEFPQLDHENADYQIVGQTPSNELPDSYEDNPQMVGNTANMNTFPEFVAGDTNYVSVSVETEREAYALTWDMDRVYRDIDLTPQGVPQTGPAGRAGANGQNGNGGNGNGGNGGNGNGQPGGHVADTIPVQMGVHWEDKKLEYVSDRQSLFGQLGTVYSLLRGNENDTPLSEIWDGLTGESSDLDFTYDLWFSGDMNALEDHYLQLEIAAGQEVSGRWGRDRYRYFQPESDIYQHERIQFADLGNWMDGWDVGWPSWDRVYDTPVDSEDIFAELPEMSGGTYGVRARVVNEDGDRIAGVDDNGNEDADALNTGWNSYEVKDEGGSLLDDWTINDVKKVWGSSGLNAETLKDGAQGLGSWFYTPKNNPERNVL